MIQNIGSIFYVVIRFAGDFDMRISCTDRNRQSLFDHTDIFVLNAKYGHLLLQGKFQFLHL